MSNKKGNWLLLVVSVLCTLLMAEVVLRFSGLAEMSARFKCFDALIGKVYCASSEGTFTRANYSNYLVINSDGMIDREYPITKPEDTLRVALLGDSFAASEYLPAKEKFEGLLEHNLTEQLGKSVEILNFGISAIETWNQLQIFHLRVAKYQPDITLLAFFWGNDIRDNIGQLRAGSPNPLLNEYEAPHARRLKEVRKNFNKALWDSSLLYQMARNGYGNLEWSVKRLFKPDYLNQIDRVIAGEDDAVSVTDIQANANLMVDTEFDDDDLFFWDSSGWKLTRKLIISLKAEAEAVGSRFVLLHFPSAGLVQSRVPLPHEDFDAFLEKNKIPYVSLFRDYISFRHDELRKHFIPGDGHWTRYGHRYVAKRAQEVLIGELSR